MGIKELSGPNCGVTVLGRAGLRYREGTQTVYLSGEMQFGESDYIIFEKKVWEWEGSEAPIDVDKQKEIIANIIATFQQHGLKVIVEG